MMRRSRRLLYASRTSSHKKLASLVKKKMKTRPLISLPETFENSELDNFLTYKI